SVVGGLVACPIIGLPTSVGYGSAWAGQTALNAMLCSCAAGLAAVGIDDGIGAGTIAARIARQAAGGEARTSTASAGAPGGGRVRGRATAGPPARARARAQAPARVPGG